LTATKFSKSGPGALFVFANCGLEDLLVTDDDPAGPPYGIPSYFFSLPSA
jgi:hypothetical protein